MSTSNQSAFDAEVANAAAQLHLDQTEVNSALVQKIFQCERSAAALRLSETRLHALLAHQAGNREDERRRIALEIHDTLGQNLLALRLDVAALHQQTGERQRRLHGWTGAALANLDDTISTVRQLIADLRPFQLELGLQAALEWETGQFQRRHGIACPVAGLAALADVAIDDGQLLVLYRVLHECLDNIARHAGATAVAVTAAVAHRTLTLDIVDNGAGIDPARPAVLALSLMGMRERLRDAGGGFALAPAVPSGTAITLVLPLRRQK